MRSLLKYIVPGLYVAIVVYFLATQGLTGESFIAIVLGLPWSLAFSFFEYWQADGALLTALLLIPIVLNTYILYRLGKWVGSR
jgi:hypothetical protein